MASNQHNEPAAMQARGHGRTSDDAVLDVLSLAAASLMVVGCSSHSAGRQAGFSRWGLLCALALCVAVPLCMKGKVPALEVVADAVHAKLSSLRLSKNVHVRDLSPEVERRRSSQDCFLFDILEGARERGKLLDPISSTKRGTRGVSGVCNRFQVGGQREFIQVAEHRASDIGSWSLAVVDIGERGKETAIFVEAGRTVWGDKNVGAHFLVRKLDGLLGGLRSLPGDSKGLLHFGGLPLGVGSRGPAELEGHPPERSGEAEQQGSKHSQRDGAVSEPPIQRRFFVMLVLLVPCIGFALWAGQALYEDRIGLCTLRGALALLFGFGGFGVLLLNVFPFTCGWWL